ncbi:MAG TPA: glycosyltransferase family 25 protein [Chitinophagaceae bacterium]|nr:glycosyltransferase family 25 protein [Chitinophagaceae bacterium]
MDFSALNNYFDKIYVITLHRATERHEKIRTALRGLNFEFFPGADNKEFSVEALKAEGVYDEALAIEHHRYSKPMNPGMLGCTISHKMVYEDVIKNNYQRVLIFEDDVQPAAANIAAFPEITEELPDDWDVVYFDYSKNSDFKFSSALKQGVYHAQKFFFGMKYSHTAINNLFAKDYSPHLKTAGYHDFLSAYAITNKAAKLLVQLQTPISFWSDHLVAYASSNQLLKSFITVPKLFLQESQFNKELTGSYAEE